MPSSNLQTGQIIKPPRHPPPVSAVRQAAVLVFTHLRLGPERQADAWHFEIVRPVGAVRSPYGVSRPSAMIWTRYSTFRAWEVWVPARTPLRSPACSWPFSEGDADDTIARRHRWARERPQCELMSYPLGDRQRKLLGAAVEPHRAVIHGD